MTGTRHALIGLFCFHTNLLQFWWSAVSYVVLILKLLVISGMETWFHTQCLAKLLVVSVLFLECWSLPSPSLSLCRIFQEFIIRTRELTRGGLRRLVNMICLSSIHVTMNIAKMDLISRYLSSDWFETQVQQPTRPQYEKVQPIKALIYSHFFNKIKWYVASLQFSFLDYDHDC